MISYYIRIPTETFGINFNTFKITEGGNTDDILYDERFYHYVDLDSLRQFYNRVSEIPAGEFQMMNAVAGGFDDEKIRSIAAKTHPILVKNYDNFDHDIRQDYGNQLLFTTQDYYEHLVSKLYDKHIEYIKDRISSTLNENIYNKIASWKPLFFNNHLSYDFYFTFNPDDNEQSEKWYYEYEYGKDYCSYITLESNLVLVFTFNDKDLNFLKLFDQFNKVFKDNNFNKLVQQDKDLFEQYDIYSSFDNSFQQGKIKKSLTR